MAKRINEPGSQGRVSSVPNVAFSNGEAESLKQLSGSLHHFSMKIQDNLDTEASIESHRKGLIDGQNGELNKELLYAPTIRGRAYTASANQAFGQRLELDTRRKIQSLAELHPGEPDVIAESLAKFTEGVAAEIPEEMRELYKAKAKLLSDAVVSRENKVAIQKQRAQAEADAVLLNEERLVDAGEIGRGLFSEFDDDRNSARRGLVSLLEDLKQGYDSKFEDAKGNEIPFFNPEQKARAITNILRTARTTAFRGWFDEKTDKVQALQDFLDGKYDPVVNGEDGEPLIVDTVSGPNGQQNIVIDLSLSAPERNAAVNYMEAEIKAIKAAKGTELKAAKAEVKEITKMMTDGFNPGSERINRAAAKASELGDPDLGEDVLVATELLANHEADKRSTPANMQAQVNAIETEFNSRDPKKGVTFAESEILKAKRKMLGTINKEVSRDPVSWATRANIIQARPIVFSPEESIDVGGGKTIRPVDTMRKRTADALTVSEYYGTPPRFFTDEEKATLTETLGDENISPVEVLGILGTVNAGFGEFADEALSEIASDEPVFAHLAGLLSQRASASTLQDESKGILLMKQGTKVISPGSNDVRTITANVLGNSFTTSEFTQQNVIRGAEAIYTARAVKQGLQGDVFDEDLWERSLQEATGAQFIAGEQFGGITEYNNSQVIAPRSIRSESFEDVMNNLRREDFDAAVENGPAFFLDSKGKKKPLDLEELLANGAGLHAIDDGRYIISQGDPSDEDARFVRGEVDLSSGTGAIRNGFVVVNLNQIEERTRAIDDQINKPFLDRAGETLNKLKSEASAEFGKISDDANLIFNSTPEVAEK